MNRINLLVTIVLLCLSSSIARADIPKPDGLVYGEVSIDGAPVSTADDIIALSLGTAAALKGAQPAAAGTQVAVRGKVIFSTQEKNLKPPWGLRGTEATGRKDRPTTLWSEAGTLIGP